MDFVRTPKEVDICLKNEILPNYIVDDRAKNMPPTKVYEHMQQFLKDNGGVPQMNTKLKSICIKIVSVNCHRLTSQ